eukprot:m.32375 g.32375  ORF g.32375 m.32375 type:complete len:877 (-) comp16633_c1_seq1:228-2858(-)
MSYLDFNLTLPQIPVFPPWCLVPQIEKPCEWLGYTIPCIQSVDPGIFQSSIQLSQWYLATVLMGLGLYVYAFIDWKGGINFNSEFMQFTAGSYAVITALFAILRDKFQFSKLLLIGAATHNLCEWAILVQIANSFGNIKSQSATQKYLAYVFVWISLICGLVATLPNMIIAVFVEQSTGIMLDFALPFIHYAAWSTSAKAKKTEHAHMYQMAFYAHLIHLIFTIVPLVFVNFHTGHTTWYSSFFLEVVQIPSAVFTHYMYIRFATEFDRLRVKGVADAATGAAKKSDDKTSNTGAAKNSEVKPNDGITGTATNEDAGQFSIRYRLALGFFLGLIPLGVVPSMLGSCVNEQVPVSHLLAPCVPSPVMVGSTVVHIRSGFETAFEDRIDFHKLVETARVFPGCMSYKLLKGGSAGEYRFIEEWESVTAVQRWIKSGPPAAVFYDDKEIKMMFAKAPEVQGPYFQPAPSTCRNGTEGVVYFHQGATCAEVWKSMENLSNCKWVIGCEHAEVNTDGPIGKGRALYMEGDRKLDTVITILDSYRKNLAYEVFSEGPEKGYKGNSRLFDTPDGGCDTHYVFTLPANSQLSVDYVVNDFVTKRVPKLQEMFKGNTKEVKHECASPSVPTVIKHDDVEKFIKVAPDSYPDQLKGIFWMDQEGAYGFSDFGVSVGDLAFTFGDTSFGGLDVENRKLKVAMTGPSATFMNTEAGYAEFSTLKGVGFEYDITISEDWSEMQVVPIMQGNSIPPSLIDFKMVFRPRLGEAIESELSHGIPSTGSCPPPAGASKQSRSLCAPIVRYSDIKKAGIPGMPKKAGTSVYYVFQIVDKDGNRVQPYYDAYVEFANSKTQTQNVEAAAKKGITITNASPGTAFLGDCPATFPVL